MIAMNYGIFARSNAKSAPGAGSKVGVNLWQIVLTDNILKALNIFFSTAGYKEFIGPKYCKM